MASLTRASGQAQGNQHGRNPLRRIRAAVSKGGESCGYDPKPDDLRVGKVKRAERHVEACQGWCLTMPSRDPRVGVKGPSSPETAGSSRNMSKHDLR